MKENLKLELDKIYEKYLIKIRLGEFKPNNGKMSFERRYEKLKDDLLKCKEKHLQSNNDEVLEYIDKLVGMFKSLCYD